jgi:His-Xaa-Ser system protein HxsD
LKTAGIREAPTGPTAYCLGQERCALEIDTTVYELSAIFRACYLFTDRCYLFLARCDEDPRWLVIALSSKSSEGDLSAAAGDFCNELVDQQLRETLTKETKPLREMIVAQAFAEGNLLDPLRDEGDYGEDPLGIGKTR